MTETSGECRKRQTQRRHGTGLQDARSTSSRRHSRYWPLSSYASRTSGREPRACAPSRQSSGGPAGKRVPAALGVGYGRRHSLRTRRVSGGNTDTAGGTGNGGGGDGGGARSSATAAVRVHIGVRAGAAGGCDRDRGRGAGTGAGRRDAVGRGRDLHQPVRL